MGIDVGNRKSEVGKKRLAPNILRQQSKPGPGMRIIFPIEQKLIQGFQAAEVKGGADDEVVAGPAETYGTLSLS